MTLKKLIAKVDAIKPNSFSDNAKVQWVNEVEGKVQTDIFLRSPENTVQYTWAADKETELLVSAPYDKLYQPYLSAMIDFANGDYKSYQNNTEMFNKHLREFARWYTDNCRPADEEHI